jgi:ribosomal-protein-alanine N-acetyltransferase
MAGPLPLQLAFERAGPGDVEAFTALEGKSAGRLYGPLGTIEDALTEIEDNILYFICQDGMIVGTIAYRMRPDGSVHISSLNVDPAHRHRGIARAAMVHVLAEAKGACRIDLVAHPENEPALQLYLSLGFKIESRRENFFGDGEPRLVLAREG